MGYRNAQAVIVGCIPYVKPSLGHERTAFTQANSWRGGSDISRMQPAARFSIKRRIQALALAD
jgi:hypothetical protein